MHDEDRAAHEFWTNIPCSMWWLAHVGRWFARWGFPLLFLALAFLAPLQAMVGDVPFPDAAGGAGVWIFVSLALGLWVLGRCVTE